MAISFTIGDRVEAGNGDDYDIGTVSEPAPHDERIPHRATDVFVAWDSGQATWTPAAGLSAA